MGHDSAVPNKNRAHLLGACAMGHWVFYGQFVKAASPSLLSRRCNQSIFGFKGTAQTDTPLRAGHRLRNFSHTVNYVNFT